MRRLLFALLACLFCALGAGCASREDQLTQAQAFLSAHREVLEDAAALCAEENRLPPQGLPGELDRNSLYYDSATGMLQVRVGGFGIAPSSTYWGVYYSPQDLPLAYDGAQVPLTPSGEGFVWEAEGNQGYTQRLEAGWYFFTASF